MKNSPEQIYFVVGIVLAIATPFLSHLIITRLFGLYRLSTDRQKGVIISAIYGLLPILAYFITCIYPGLTEDSISYLPDFAYLMMLYGASSYVYFHFFNTSETSRRVRILVSSDNTNGPHDSIIPEGYNIDQMIAVRLERLISLRELTVKDGKYRIGRGLLLPAARIVSFFRELLFPGEKNQTTTWTKISGFTLATLVLAVFTNSAFFLDLSSPYNSISLALFCGAIGTIAYSLLSYRPCLKNYLLVSIPYLFITSSFVYSDLLPGRDTNAILYPIFQFFAEAFTSGYSTPTWLPISGGIDVGLFHVNSFPFLPNRLVGYSIAALFPISFVTAYKIQLVTGVLFLAYGWFAVIAHLTRSQHAAYWGTICILMGGTGITFHQEHVIATSHLLPWFTLCLLRLREQRLYILPASALFALGLSTHYPQIQLISMSLAATAIILWQRPALASVVSMGKRFSFWIALLLLFGGLPSLYIWHHGDELASPIRATESLRPISYAEYLELNEQQVSSAPPWYFNQYVRPHHEAVKHTEEDYSDLYGMFVGRISLLLCIVALIVRPYAALPILVLLSLFAELTMGINSNLSLPKLLFEARFPFINVFRQWYHFFPFINLLLSLLSALGFAIIISSANIKKSLFKQCIIIVFVFINFFDLAYYDHIYMRDYCRSTIPEPLQQNLSAKNIWWQTFQYRDRFKLTRDCVSAIPPAITTTAYLTTIDGVDAERALACNLSSQSVVATNIPEDTARGLGKTGKIINFPIDETDPNGAHYHVLTPIPALLVSSINYSLGASAYIDGKPAKIWRVNSAISGLLIDAGEHNIEFRRPAGFYAIISCIQVMLYCCTGLILIALSAMGQQTGKFTRDSCTDS